MALNVKQQIKKQGFETSQRKKKTERRYTTYGSTSTSQFTYRRFWAKAIWHWRQNSWAITQMQSSGGKK